MRFESLQALQKSFAQLDNLIRAAVTRAQEAGHDPTDAMRGLIISAEEVHNHLEQSGLTNFWENEKEFPVFFDTFQTNDIDSPFLRLLSTFDLNPVDAYILLLCLAPELDRRYERLYAYLQDDVSQRRPTVNLMMNLLGGTVEQRFVVWERLHADAPLRQQYLLDVVPDTSRPNSGFLSHILKVDQRVIAHLLGHSMIDERLKHYVRFDTSTPTSALSDEFFIPLCHALPDAPVIYMQGHSDTGQRETAQALCATQNLNLISVDAAGLKNLDMPFEKAWRLALREAHLINAAFLVENWQTLLNDEHQPDEMVWGSLLSYPQPVFLCGNEDWEPLIRSYGRRMLRANFSIPNYDNRRLYWENAALSENLDVPENLLDELANKFKFTQNQIHRAIATAVDLAASKGVAVDRSHLYAGAQAHGGLRLGHLAKRIVPRASWEDLILPPDQLSQLREMTVRIKFNFMVRENWGFARRKQAGVSVLFAGESGTGKTLAAEVLAGELGLVMYRIDLSSVVSKYIGETEKNLSVIFNEAQSSSAVLFFDEADALFGKRSEVKDARDRYANIEIAYLLQQIEDYDGIAILATNLRQNLDEAFTRRLDFLIDFPFPESEYRQKIWELHFPTTAPVAKDVDFGAIAERYHLPGGNIRNAALTAAYLAAADGGIITNTHIRNAIRREHQKMGRLLED